MQHRTLQERLRSLEHSLGSSTLRLRLGRRTIDLEGLDAPLVAELAHRWGGFIVPTGETPADCTVRFHRAGPGTWLDHWEPGETYRVEAIGEDRDLLVASYHFGIARGNDPATWRVGISDEPDEPIRRIVDNVVRFLAAHLALDDGGFAMHSAGVLYDGRAYQLAGPSRAGKSTASRLIAGAESLGDDFGMIVRDETGWLSPALPFDNSECVERRPSSGVYPLAGVLRVHQAVETSVTAAAELEAGAALMSCVAFAWAMPERSDELLHQVREFASLGLFRNLHFALGSDLGPHLAGSFSDPSGPAGPDSN